ncbi:MAG TPA: alpha-hydroxy acid oxidase [Acidimicrobiales bacterium]|nr:alpha-hydroxy acid oxidase [Acidimicrobiales bacterium]
MRPAEIRELLRLGRPPARHGSTRLARAWSIADLRRLALRRVPSAVQSYLEGGGEDEVTLRRNRSAFEELELVPRVLRDVHDVDTAVTVLGTPLPVPFALAPVGSARLFHHQGELAASRAAAARGVPFSLSSSGTCSIEQVAAHSTGPLWYQLYVWRDRGLCKELLQRARAAGYRALLVTVDTTVRSKRERELRAGLDLPTPSLTWATLLDGALHPDWSFHFLTSEAIRFANLASLDASPSAGMSKMARSFDGLTTWDDLEWIAATWDGPIALKGILALDDARRAAQLGVGAVVVSNHGGRQLDRVPAAVTALPAIVEAVGGQVEVLMDSGIRRGTDLLTALSLGARACLIGRAYLYGLAAAGEAGVGAAIDILAEELRTAMALCGAPSLADLSPGLVQARRPAVPERPAAAARLDGR